MNQTIIDAINERRTLTFFYHGERRVVEPHCYGEDTKGHDALRAYQLGGKGWRFFHVRDMEGGLSLGSVFPRARPDYKRNDEMMDRIYAQL
ncbi:hypothetical protein [Sinisalibacter lacisalsi]|uniref:WYL domain-containing protein n=1 Tax=Sinisalibacter lacisalsi TaxID=1526570 RepID=A0ABQ1QYM8_9RHOB|nr:hypothetical protein [Sinisalibacter lacisalsi]GGD47872.1 hypothetical protein GCM10011358_34630 [Sinisalibacter lacisalsi]